MRILMHTRADWRELSGGDFVQLQRWTTWLRALGLEVRISDDLRPNLAGIDLVHFHNLSRAYCLWSTLEHCRQRGVPAVLTTLYWPADEFEQRGRPGWSGWLMRGLPFGIRDRLKPAARWFLQGGQRRILGKELWLGTTGLSRRFLAGFSALIANSSAEADEIHRLAPQHPPIHLVHSGVDACYWSGDRELWAMERKAPLPGGGLRLAPEEPLNEEPEENGPRQGVLCVARFDPQKGQHRLIEALKPLQVPLTLVGPDNPHYPGYRDFCQKQAGPEVVILSRQGPTALRRLYRRCQVFALCSWYEVSALSGLEAGCCGARVVMTARGGWRDYGSDLAWYADPADPESIRHTVQQALQAARTPDLHGHVLRHFTWERSARSLMQAYQATLEQRSCRPCAA
jgi:glycosyltransferase involved in cell wall biosynthesis